MIATFLMAAFFCSAPPPPNRAAVADGEFIGEVAKIHLDYMHATEYFVVDPAAAVKPTGKIKTELERVKPWLRNCAKPDLAAELEKADWVAYKDVTQRVEPLVAQCTYDDDTVRWSFGAHNAALLVDLGSPADLGDEAKVNAFALDFLRRLLALPERAPESVKCGFKRYGDLWGGYVARGLPKKEEDDLNGLWYWDMSILVVTDGRHVLVRWLLAEPDDLHPGNAPTGDVQGRPAKKTKSRFDG